MNKRKKQFKFNRFNIGVTIISFILLLYFFIAYFNTFSELVTREASNIKGDTVTINDLASDYYYYLGMNYVGDLYSNNVNYSDSSLKMVTINYYGYPNGNSSLTGYVSHKSTERQNKFVYYKYYPIVNNRLTIELIDNPFTYRPTNKAFGGWTSSDGTITKDSNTNTYTMSVSSSVSTINIYANWIDANVIYLKGVMNSINDDGDDSFDGKTPKYAVGSWERAFELLENNTTNRNDREQNIIVLMGGDFNHSINYTRPLTHTVTYTYTYTDHETFTEGQPYMIVYRNNNTRYALTGGSTIGAETLQTNTEPSSSTQWLIHQVSGGYTIQNASSNRYLNYSQINNEQVSIFMDANPCVWQYDTNVRAFFENLELNFVEYRYTEESSITSGNVYSLGNGTQNLLRDNNGTIANYVTEQYNQVNGIKWRINSTNNGYTFYNTTTNKYLGIDATPTDSSLTLTSSPYEWQYDFNTKKLSVDATINTLNYNYAQNNVSAATAYLGTVNTNNNTATVMRTNFGTTNYTTTNGPTTAEQWTIAANGNNFTIRSVQTGQYLSYSGGNNNARIALSATATNWTYDTANHRLIVQVGNRTYYMYYTNNAWSISRYNYTNIYLVTYTTVNVPAGTRHLELAFNANNWNVAATGTNVSILSSTQQDVELHENFYLRYSNNSFVFDRNNTNGTPMYFTTYEENFTLSNRNHGNIATNDYYTNSTNIAATITSQYNGVDYMDDASIDLTVQNNGTSYYRFNVLNDLQLENLNFTSVGYDQIDDTTVQTNYSTSRSSLVGNSHNVRLGRGLTPTSWSDDDATVFCFLQGGSSSSIGSTSNDNNAYKLVIESGRYSGMMVAKMRNNYGTGTNYYNYYGQANAVFGSDYDRATNNNDLLDFYYRIGSNNYYGVHGRNNINNPVYLFDIKSGTFGRTYFDNNPDEESRAYSGIYVGGLTVNADNNTTDNGARIIIVEGGDIANVLGGLRISQTSGNNGAKTKIYVKNGTVQNVIGGAGVSTTYGDRYVSVTGGSIAYSVSAGSNGVAATSTQEQQSGRLAGDTYVHVGGVAKIGTAGSGSLYGVTYGSVLGAGNGNEDTPASGRVNTSHVYISGSAQIAGNVYGGGNYGPVLEDVYMTIDGGKISGSVYGGANKNGVGSVTINESTVYNVDYTDVETITSGETYLINKLNGNNRNLLSQNNNQQVSNTNLSGSQEPSNYSRWIITSVTGGYSIRNLNYNYYLNATTGITPNLSLGTNTTNGVWQYDTTNKTFYQDVNHLISTTVSYESVNSVSSGSEYVIRGSNTNNAQALNSSAGSTQLSTTSLPDNIVWIFTASGNGYTIRNKDTGEYLVGTNYFFYTELDMSNTAQVWRYNNNTLSTDVSSWFGTNTYYLRYNNGWSLETSQYNVYLAKPAITGQTRTDRYYVVYDTNWHLSTTASSLLISTYRSSAQVTLVASNAVDGDVSITMNGGEISGALYGGSCETGDVAGHVTMNINGGTIAKESNNGSVFGGGYGLDTNIANGVTLNIKDTDDVSIDGVVYGGSALGAVIGNIDVKVTDTASSKKITLGNNIYCGAMGDDDTAKSGTVTGNCTIEIDGGTYTSSSVFGGNNTNGSPQRDVTVRIGGTTNTTVRDVFGGGNEADSTANKVEVHILDKAIVTNAFGGGNDATVDVTHVYLEGGTVTNAYGGNNHGDSTTTNVSLTGSTVTNLYGGSNESGAIATANVTTNGGTATNIYGGNNLGGNVAVSNVTINTGTITNIYGGGNEATTGTTNVNLNGGSITGTVYGGGNKAGVSVATNVNLDGSTVANIYGGSNQTGDVLESNITVDSGNATTIYGGNNQGGVTTTSNITINRGTVGTVYGGGNIATTGTTNIDLVGGNVTTVYGGGNAAGISVGTNVTLTGSSCGTIFGGSNSSGNVPLATVVVDGGSANTVYGGNNVGGVTTSSNVTINGSTIGNVYGGGKQATTGNTNVTVTDGTITNLFGGGESANISNNAVISITGTSTTGITNVYGGSNQSGSVSTTSITVDNGKIQNIYGGNNLGGSTTTTNVTINDGQITGTIYGGGNEVDATTTNVIINGNTGTTAYVYGGGNKASNTITNVTISNGTFTNVFGGSNTSGTIGTSNVNISGGTITNLYGGNNQGGTTTLANTTTTGGTINKLYGGGKNAATGATVVSVDHTSIISDLFGGGDNAAVNGNTQVRIKNGSAIGGNLFGGGNNGVVTGSTNVRISSGTISGSAYGGGNGATAIVSNNTLIVHECGATINQHLFGGGNAAATGNVASNNSTSIVNITGGIVRGNVYGGANTSVIYGEAFVNIGINPVTEQMGTNDYNYCTIDIGGTVFGGGEANASGSEEYDFDFISVTTGIIIKIDGARHSDLTIGKSIFGSGNASSTSGYSRVYISNYGSSTDVKDNISLQRADIVYLDHSYIALRGATDRTNEYSTTLFSISRVPELVLKNNSEIYLSSGANLLEKLSSLDSSGNKARVTINDKHQITERTVNNKLYTLEDNNINIAKNQNATSYGEVDGMTFFGLFRYDRNGEIVRALYDTNYTTGSDISSNDLYYFSSGSYVLGLHEQNHNIKVDGFYTNYADEDNEGELYVDYIEPTPEQAPHYMWIVGVPVVSYEIDLVASRYSTLGTSEFSFINNSEGNTTFSIVGFTYDELEQGVSLINPDNIPRVANTADEANNTMGIAIKPGNGIISVGSTYFLTDAASLYNGTTAYKTENSTITPSLIFYLYHSKNITANGSMGSVTISVLITTPINDLKNKVSRVNFVVNLSRALYDTSDYEAAMKPGREYQMFTSSNMDITSNSSLSAYFALFTYSNQTIYRTGYHRVLTSNVILPVNTKITMIDFASSSKPEYYYYIVNQQDNNTLGANYNVDGTISYPLSNFIKMGSTSTNNNYDDAAMNQIYYYPDDGLAMEEFIFIIDFAYANINQDMLNCSLLIELLSSDNAIVKTVLSIQREQMVYNLHANQSAVIDISATLSDDPLYIGNVDMLRVTTDFLQNDNGSSRIIDTTYYDMKMGLKVSFFDSRGDQVNGMGLLGTTLVLDGVTYYARSDGTYRFKVSDRVANLLSNIKIDTTNSSLPGGLYTIKIEGFYSPDGIYFGQEANDVYELTLHLLDNTYGLDVTVDDEETIIDDETALNAKGTHDVNLAIRYNGVLTNPNIKIALYRRNYDEIYSTTYTLVDFKDYFTNNLTETGEETKTYSLLDSLSSENDVKLTLKNEDLVTGTYKLELLLYDSSSYVGEVSKYIIIK